MNSFFLRIRTYARWYTLFLLLVISIVLGRVVLHEDRHGLTFAALNIGQGDALFIESPTGVQVVIDGGPNNALLREIPRVMPWYDKHIDMLIVTNPDKDHYEGFISLLKHYNVDVVVESGTNSPTDTYAALEREIKDKGIPKIIARRGQIIDIGGGAYIEILFPDRDVSGLSSNDGSIVARLVYGDTSVLLQGDSTAKIEHYLFSLRTSLKSTVLKVGHHGSRTSTTEEYVKEVSPEYALISAGVNNKYGHPHKETIDTLNKYKVKILGTYEMGQIVLHSDGKQFSLSQ